MPIQNKECEECGRTLSETTFKKTRKVKNKKLYCPYCGTDANQRFQSLYFQGDYEGAKKCLVGCQ